MSNTTRTTPQKLIVLREARKAQARNTQMLENYYAACEDDRKNGHRPQYCVHGVNMWVDYDCACYQCEGEGNTLYDLEAMTTTDFIRETLEDYRRELPVIQEKFKKLADAYLVMHNMGNRITTSKLSDVFNEISDELFGRWGSNLLKG